jgi:hypothetical protein
MPACSMVIYLQAGLVPRRPGESVLFIWGLLLLSDHGIQAELSPNPGVYVSWRFI